MIDPITLTTLSSFIPTKNVHSGKQLKKILGLEDYDYVWIRKIINLPISVYIVVYNSRFPNLYLPLNKVRNLKAFHIFRTNKIVNQELDDFIMSMPYELERYNKRISSKSIILSYDIAGEYYANKEVSEFLNNR